MMISRPGGCSAAALQREIQTCYETAWRIMHRLREAMLQPDIRLIGTPLISGLSVWCQRPGREQFDGGPAWVWAATDEEKVVTRYSSIPSGGRALAAMHSDTLEFDDSPTNAARQHLCLVRAQLHWTHQSVSQKWLPRYLRETSFRANCLGDLLTAANRVLETALARKYEPFKELVPDVWCPPTPDLEGPFIGVLETLDRLAPSSTTREAVRYRHLRW